jgi:divalent metal cation (Fe/Co/Zn/Cd) transporter
MDVKLPADEETWIRQLIMTRQPVIHGFHQLRTRKAGNFRFVDFHIKVDPSMSVEDSHRITDELSGSIESHFPNTNVTVHIEPCDGTCSGDCLSGCLLPESEQKAVMQKNRRV